MIDSTLPPIRDHVDGLGLNDILRIDRDERDPKAGNASHEYRFVLNAIPSGDPKDWHRVSGGCAVCDGELCLTHCGDWVHCLVCGVVMCPSGEKYTPAEVPPMDGGCGCDGSTATEWSG